MFSLKTYHLKAEDGTVYFRNDAICDEIVRHTSQPTGQTFSIFSYRSIKFEVFVKFMLTMECSICRFNSLCTQIRIVCSSTRIIAEIKLTNGV